jgi:1-acyl-sn-glycerol-3-phosphate acyltransferase
MAVTKFESSTMNFLAKMGLVDFIYSLFGVFTVTPGLGIDKNIHKAKEIIRIGGNIVMYPEGRVTHGGAVGQFKKGAAVLQHETRVQIIPVSFRRFPRRFLRSRIQINVGEILDVDEYRSVDEVTNIFYKVICRLYARR